MRVEMVEIGVQLRRLTIISIRKSYRLVCNHPFLVGMFLFLFFVYRSFPFLFSLLVSTSPVVVCTAFLLGFLLSLGDPNIPEIEKEESVEHEIISLRTEVQRDTTVVERDESFVVERYASSKSRDEVERLIEQPISKNDIVDHVDGCLVSTGPIIEDYFTEIKSERRDIEGVDGELQDPHMNERKSDETVFLENHYSRIEEMDEESVGLLSKSPVGSIGSVVTERGDSLPGSPWKQFGEGDDDVADEDSDSGSDRAESSSPDASMADIIPMLEELHPLLNEETPVVTRGSDDGSHRSRGYRESPNDSGEESENHDDMDDEEERDEKGGAEDDETKPEITWTDDDQKNVMDLGTLELERNQRLESLIARRRARKMMAEKNLIDLNFDLPFGVTPILTTRRNPFDIPYDSNEFAGLPPIPGSAPSIMSQRRNPFDLPYDSSEEKPDLTEDSFQQEFSPLPSREMMFRRHESFNVGPSIFAPPKHDRDDFRFRPYFVPEGSSHSSFRRQTSELSDISKVSSVPETDSICSVGDQDDKKIAEEDISQYVEMGSDLEDPSELVGHETELICSVGEQDDRKIAEEDISRDVEMGSDLEDPSELVGHGSESSEDENVMELGRKEKKETEHDEVEMPSVSVARALSTIEEVHYSSGSSSSALSEEHEGVVDEKKHEVSMSLELEMDKVQEQADVNKEPVYDLSPSSVQKNLSRSSILSEFLVDQTPETGKTVVDFSDRQIDFCTQNTEMDTQCELNLMGTNESGTSGVTAKAVQILDRGVSEYDGKFDPLENQDESNEHEEDHVSSSSLSLDSHHVKTLVQNDLVAEQSIIEDIVLRSTEDHTHSSSSNAYSDWVSVEKPMDELHFLDKPVVDSSANDHEELLEPPTVQLESIAEDQNEDNALSEDHNFDKTLEATSSQVHEANFIEEGDEVEEIDEGLLMELDNVGDFSIGELRSSLNESPLVETRSVEDIGSILLRTEPVPMQNETEINSGMLVLEAEEVKSGADVPSIEEVEAECSQIAAETENKTVFESIHYDVVDSGMHELEATSIQDIDAAFRQTNDDEIEKPVIVDPQNAESLPEKIEAEVAQISGETENKTVLEPIHYDEIGSGMHGLEATSVIDAAFRQTNDDEIEKPVIVDPQNAESLPEKIEAEVAEISEETENKTVFEPIHYDEIGSGMHELEASSIQEIDKAFKQIIDEEFEKPVTGDSLPEKFEAELTEIIEETGSKTVSKPILYDKIDAAMLELEATSIQDIDTAFRQINDEEIEKPVIVSSLDAELPEKIEAQVPEIGEETENKTVLEPIHYDGTSSGMHEVEATLIQDIDTAFRQIDDEEIEKPVVVDSLDAESLPGKFEAEVAESSEEVENKSVFERILYDELEATSIQDIDTAFKKIHVEEIEKPLIVDSLDAASLPQNIEAELSEIGEETENKTVFETILDYKIDSAIHELEATSIQDISTASRQINHDGIEKPVAVDPLDAESLTENFDADVAEIREETESKTVFEPVHYDKIDSGMHELEDTSVQEIDTAFKKIHEEEIEKPLIVDSLDAASLPENIKAEVAEISEETENKNVSEAILYEEIDSAMHELEATSVEDINRVFRRIKEEEIEKPVVVESRNAESLPEKDEPEVSKIEAPEPPIVEARFIENIDLAIEQHSNLERYVTAVSEYYEPYILETEDKAEEINSGTLGLDSTSIKDIDEAFSQNNKLENSAVLEPTQDEEFDSGMAQLEAQSLDDLNSVFRKIKEEIENPVTVDSLEADAVEKSEARVSEIEMPELPVLEARSIESIDLTSVPEKARSSIPENDKPDIIEADDQTEEISSTIVELDAESVKDIDLAVSQIKELENSAVFDPTHAEEMGSGMNEFEARSLKDLNSAFRQINEEAIETSAIAASLEYDLVPEKSDAGVSELERPELPVVEARSIEDIGLAFQQVHNIGKYRNSLLDSDKPDIIKAEDRAEEVNSQMLELDAQPIKDADLAPEESEDGVSEIETREMPVVEASSIEDISLAFEQVHDSEENSSSVSENNNPVITETEDEKEETNSEMVELDAQSIKDIDAAFSLIKEAEKPVVVEPITAETVDLETKDFEAGSPEDINLTFRHITNEEVEKPISVASLIADLAADKSEAGASEIETPELPVVEASFIEDIGLKQAHESAKNSSSISENDKPVIVEAKDQARSIEDIYTSFDQINETQSPSAFEPVHAEEVISGMKELEAQSLEDIETAFKQFKDEEIEKPVVVESLNAELISEKDETEISETDSTQKEPGLEEMTRMVLPVVDKPSSETENVLEPRSSLQVESENKANSFDDDTQDIESKTRGDSHPARSNEETDNLEQLKSKIEDGSVGTESNDVHLSGEAETSIKEPVKAQTSGNFSKEFESGVEISSVLETSTSAKENEPNIEMPSPTLESDNLNSSLSVGKDKKGKSRKSKSGSGSSSSSGSSDSD